MFYEENDYYHPYQAKIPYSTGAIGAARTEEAGLNQAWTTPQENTFQAPLYAPRMSVPAPTPLKSRQKRSGGGHVGRTLAIFALALVLLLVLGVGLFAGWVVASNGNSSATVAATSTQATTSTTTAATSALEAQQEAAIAKIEPAVVELNVVTAQAEQVGSGVIIDKNGDIITNNHVINGAQTITAVLQNGKSVKAQIVGSDAANDLAVVRITPTPYMAVATIGDSSKLAVGQEVLAVGNPLGITETATKGIVSALNRSVVEETGGATITGAIQTDAPINPGNSGGALVNLQGQLVGIPTLAAIDTETHTPANGVGFAIPASKVEKVVSQIVH